MIDSVLFVVDSSNLNINDVLGGYSLTLIDVLDTLAVSRFWFFCFDLTADSAHAARY